MDEKEVYFEICFICKNRINVGDEVYKYNDLHFDDAECLLEYLYNKDVITVENDLYYKDDECLGDERDALIYVMENYDMDVLEDETNE